MDSPYRYKLDPIKTPGYCHVDGLTEESAHVANLILQSNRTAYHVFTTDFDKMGVSNQTSSWNLKSISSTRISSS